MTNEELWQAALGEIELSISKANFITWFKNTAILSNENGKILIGVPNGFAKEWLENKYKGYVVQALRGFQPDLKEISCAIYNFQETPQKTPKESGQARISNQGNMSSDDLYPFPQTSSNFNINSRYLFENFIVGENNELAKAACYAVSQNLGRVYNPLFIYGGVGLGKTHLLQSIGNEVIKRDPDKKIRYMTSERFASELIDS